jgi:hypothetical protein
MFWTVVLPIAIYWLMFFVVQYILLEYGQPYLYDETIPWFGLKVLAGSFVLAMLAARFHPSFDTMFTNNIHWSLLQAMAWVGIFTLLYQFQPLHALSLGLMSFVFVPGLATMTADSLSQPRRPVVTREAAPTGPHRGSLVTPTPAAPVHPPGQPAAPAPQ